jgi:hypothetical protein
MTRRPSREGKPRKTKSPARRAASACSQAKRITPPDAVAVELRALSEHVRANPGQGAGAAERLRVAFPEVSWPGVY